jgi:hypothetical protein
MRNEFSCLRRTHPAPGQGANEVFPVRLYREKKMDICCEECANFVYDDEEEEYVCCVSMDEDDYIRLNTDSHYQCPYYQCGDEYKIVRHQM